MTLSAQITHAVLVTENLGNLGWHHAGKEVEVRYAAA